MYEQLMVLVKTSVFNRRMRKTARPGGVGALPGEIPARRPDHNNL